MSDYERYTYYKDNAETMARLGQIGKAEAIAIVSYYEEKAKDCLIDGSDPTLN